MSQDESYTPLEEGQEDTPRQPSMGEKVMAKITRLQHSHTLRHWNFGMQRTLEALQQRIQELEN